MICEVHAQECKVLKQSVNEISCSQVIAKLRCSDHALEIEKGRHKKIDRTARLCKVCDKREIKTEDHFLKHCEIYSNLRNLYEIPPTLTSSSIFKDLDPKLIGNFLLDAWSERNHKLNSLWALHCTAASSAPGQWLSFWLRAAHATV